MKKAILIAITASYGIVAAFSQTKKVNIELVQPGIISATTPEFAATTTPDGAFFVFNRMSVDRKKMSLMYIGCKGGATGQVSIPTFTDTTYWEIDPSFSPDGKRLFFTSERPLKGRGKKDFDIWYVEKKKRRWGKPKRLSDTVNTSSDEVYSTTTLEGTLYFSRITDKKAKIYSSALKAGTYQTAIQVVLPGTDTSSVINPAISPNGDWLVFSSGELGGQGSADIFASRHLGGNKWASPTNLFGINSVYADFAPAFTPDGKYLYFTSERPGIVKEFPDGNRRPGDIYRVTWEEIKPLE